MRPSMLWQSKRLNFVQFIIFKNSTNFEYWNLDTSHSLPILKNPQCPLFLYLVDFGTALSTQSTSSSIVFGKRNLPSAMAKTICKSLQVHNTFEYNFGATRNCWILRNTMNADWIQQITHTRHFKERWEKIQQCTILYCFFGEGISKARASCFITISRHSKTDELGRSGLVLSSVFSCLEIVMKHPHSFFEIILINRFWHWYTLNCSQNLSFLLLSELAF